MSSGSRARLWPWLVAFVVAAAAVWLGVAIVDRRGPPEPAEPFETVVPPEEPSAGGRDEPVTGAVAEELMERTEQMRAAVRRYERDCAARLEPVVGEGLGALVAECIEGLSAAVDAVVASDTVGRVTIDERFAEYREQVERLERTPPGEGRAGPTREVLRSMTELLAVIREERYPESLGEAGVLEELRTATEAIDLDRPLDRQRHTLRRFFVAAGGLLSAMARPGDPGPGP